MNWMRTEITVPYFSMISANVHHPHSYASKLVTQSNSCDMLQIYLSNYAQDGKEQVTDSLGENAKVELLGTLAHRKRVHMSHALSCAQFPDVNNS